MYSPALISHLTPSLTLYYSSKQKLEKVEFLYKKKKIKKLLKFFANSYYVSCTHIFSFYFSFSFFIFLILNNYIINMIKFKKLKKWFYF